MAQVPYSPVPGVAPIHGGPSGMRFDTSGAFGENIGRALEGLGKTVAGAGDELFSRAIALQQVANETEAKEADTKYIMAVGEQKAQYDSLLGRSAVDGYKPFTKGIQDLRTEIRNSLSNDASRKLFDSSSLYTMSRTVFSAASHSATQNKKWALGASEARVAAAGDQALASPKDEAVFKENLDLARRETMQQGDLLGWDPDQLNQALAAKTSTLWSKRIDGLARTDPMKANKLLDEAIKRGDIRGEDIGKITNLVRQQVYTTGARVNANKIATGVDLQPGSSVVPIERAMAAIGIGIESGGDYTIKGPEVLRKDGTSRGRPLGKYQVMPENLQPWLKEAGLPPMTEQEYLNNPKAQDQVFSKIFGGYMTKYGSFNEAASVWFSGSTIKDAQARNATDQLGTNVAKYLQKTNAYLAKTTPLTERLNRAGEIAETEVPHDPLYGDYLRKQVTADYSSQQVARRNDDYNNRQTIEGALFSDEQGNVPTTVDQLIANPVVASSWAQLDNTTKRKYLNILTSNEEGDVTWDDNRIRRYDALKTLARSDPKEFVSLDIAAEDLPWSARRALLDLRQKAFKNAEGDPRITSAMQVMIPQLNEARIFKNVGKGTEYYLFQGALMEGIKSYTEQNKKYPPRDEIIKIGTQLLQDQATGGWWGTVFGADKQYTVPADAKKVIIEGFTKNGDPTPTDQQITQIYFRRHFQKLYAKPPSSARP